MKTLATPSNWVGIQNWRSLHGVFFGFILTAITSLPVGSGPSDETSRSWVSQDPLFSMGELSAQASNSARQETSGDFAFMPFQSLDKDTEVSAPCAACQNAAIRKPQLKPIRVAQAKPKAAAPAVVEKVALEGALPHAQAIQNNLKYGKTVGHRPMCGLAVWRILIKAGLVHGSWSHSGANAIEMGPILRAQGFVSDPAVCNRPGVVRIYNGNQSGHRFKNAMTGDWAGHIEILGLDGNYHSFFDSPNSMSESMRLRYGYASRRPLQSCWYKP